MKDRTLRILTALIEDFVENAIPVASKKLLLDRHFDISSATVRNEFALLEEIGLIESPHVSAGKIPTQKGYRFFVDELLYDEKEEKRVQSLFEKHIQHYRLVKTKEILFDMLRLLSQLSGNVAFVNINNDKTAYLGLSNVLRSPEFMTHPEKVAQIVEIFEGQERFQNMLNSLNINEKDVKIFIGEENLLEEISSCAMLVTKFASQEIHGNIGILGPMRMKYGFNKALLRNVLEML
jgi:transcriptional regulator of heat shock response